MISIEFYINRDVFVDEAFSLLASRQPPTVWLAHHPILFFCSIILFFFGSLYLREGHKTAGILTFLTASISMLLSQPVAYDVHPPLHYTLLRLWTTIFGSTIISARILSSIFFILFLITVYHYVRKYYNINTAILTTLILTLSSTAIHYSNEIRQYSLLLLLSATSFLLLRQYLNTKNTDYEILLIINQILLAYTHPYTLLLIITQHIILWKENHKIPIHTATTVILSILPMALLFKTQIAQISNMWLAPPNYLSYPSSINFALNYTDQLKGTIQTQTALISFILILTLIMYATITTKNKWTMYAFFMVTIPQIPPLIMTFWTHTYHHRYFLIFTWQIALLCAITINHLYTTYKKTILQPLAPTLLILLLISMTLVNIQYQRPHELQTTAKQIPDQATIIHESSFSADPLMVYKPQTRNIWLTNLTPKQVNSACGAVIPKENIIYKTQNLPPFDYYLEARHVLNTENMTLITDTNGLRLWHNKI